MSIRALNFGSGAALAAVALAMTVGFSCDARLAIASAPPSATTGSTRAAHARPTVESTAAPIPRITTPAGADPTVYVFAEIGSHGITQAHLQLMRALYTTDSTLSPREREAMRTTIAAIEENIRTTTPPRLEFSNQVLPEAFYANIDHYRTWPGYSERERLAMEFVRRFDLDHQRLDADTAFWRRMHRNFSDREIADMCVMAGAWLGIHYMNRALGITPAPRLQNAGPDMHGTPVVGEGTLRLLQTFEHRGSSAQR